jgi:succinylglutamate desuccinylase
VLEVVERRAIDAEDCFHMEPGFRNLNHARRGQLLARDRRGEIRAPSDGVVILPLYQKLGSDGFFWGRTVSETRLRASKVLRTLRAEKLLEVLPGVQRDPALPSRYVVEPGFGRRYAFELLQMLGFRRIRAQQGALVFERQEDRGRR